MNAARLVRVLVPVLLVAGLLLDATLPGRAVPPPPTPPAALAAGSATCAATGSTDGATTALQAVAGAAPPALADRAATATLRTVQDGDVLGASSPTTTGAVVVEQVPAGLEAPLLALRWRTTPMVVGRTWVRPGTELAPGGVVTGPCPSAAGDRWVVAGVATAGGATAQLHLANPFDATATAQVRFTTPGGLVEPARLRNVVVPASGTLALDLGDFAPEEPDLGVLVDVEAGRLVAEAVQVLQPAIGGVAGATLVPATTTAAELWTIPWIEGGPTTSAWLWVTNPGEEPADVRLVAHTPDGPDVPPDAGLVVPPGSTERIDLSQVAVDGARAVTVRSTEGAPVVVAGTVVVADEEPRRSGVAVTGGARPAGGALVVLVPDVTADARLLRVVNPGEADATVDVEVRDDEGVLAGAGQPGVVVPAGGTVDVELAALPPGAHAVVVTPRDAAPVAAALVQRTAGDAEADLDLVATTATPFPSLADVTPLRPVLDPTLAQRVGTPLAERAPR